MSLPVKCRIYINDDSSVTISSLFGDLIPFVTELGYIKTKNESEVKTNGIDV